MLIQSLVQVLSVCLAIGWCSPFAFIVDLLSKSTIAYQESCSIIKVLSESRD